MCRKEFEKKDRPNHSPSKKLRSNRITCGKQCSMNYRHVYKYIFNLKERKK